MNGAWLKFFVKKQVAIMLTLLFVTILSFLLMRLSPVDPAVAYVRRGSPVVTEEMVEEARVQLGFNAPLPRQYLNWLKRVFRGDLGASLVTGRPVIKELAKVLPVTLRVVALTAVLMIPGSVIVACLGSMTSSLVVTFLISVLYIMGVSIPSFFLASLFQDVFSVSLGCFTIVGNQGIWRYLPSAICLSVSGIALYGSLLQKALERELSQDWADYARCRGLSDIRMLLYHALPGALVDLLPSFAQSLGLALAGACIVERVFSLPGLGYFVIESVLNRDSNSIHAAVLVFALVLSLLDFLAEILQRLLTKGEEKGEVIK